MSLRNRKNRMCTGEQENDLLAGLTNLLDVMLVFCVGLMIALVLSWNLQNIIFIDVKRGRELEEIPQLQQEGGEGYHEMGKVYQDPETGKLILIEEIPQNKNSQK
ncbi:MAG: hypothetical protein CVU88_05590 [Firmicutes bacterium HGW-Firmicutes-13]|nr:MAG: hypothetical protein CVU88_05590 [Firmicutes bacterium HGW-Firmicutes-13]